MPSMALLVTRGTESDQVARYIGAKLAPPFEVMNLQVAHGAAILTAPAVAFEDVSSESRVVFSIELEPAVLWAKSCRVR